MAVVRAATPRFRQGATPRLEGPPKPRTHVERTVDPSTGAATEAVWRDGRLVTKRTVPPPGTRAMPEAEKVKRATARRAGAAQHHRGR